MGKEIEMKVHFVMVNLSKLMGMDTKNNMKCSGLWFMSIFFIFATVTNAQQLTVTGEVTSSSNEETLPGVNISIVGQDGGTVTDLEGQYELEVSSDDTLSFSYIGYQALTVPVDGRNVIDVSLEESTEALDEVIVMGYRAVSKRDVSSSISQVSGDALEQVTTHDPTEMIEGQMSGVNVSQESGRPGTNADITVRGMGSISAGTSPLYVVDGVIAGSGARDAVSPSDIESITVLKDASATALYGSRASNGVVVIQTKAGTSGDTQIDIRSARGYNTTLHGNEKWMNSEELYEFHQNMANAEDGPFYNNSDLLNTDTNWRDIGFDTGITQMYEASVSGGDDQTTFYVSGNYFEEEGTNIGTNYDRISGRVKLDHSFNDRFRISSQVTGNYAVRDNVVAGDPYDILTFSQRNLPWDSPWNDDGSVRTGLESDWYSRDTENPLHGMQWNYDLDKTSYYAGDIRLQYNLFDWAYFSSTNRFSTRDGRREVFFDARSQAGTSRNGELNHENDRSTSVITSNLLHLERSGEIHSLSGLAGFEYQDNRSEDTEVVGTGLAPDMTILDAASTAFSTGGNIGESTYASLLAQAEYDYDERYILTASYRLDGSSRFGADNRWGNFYSLGGSWMLHNESFMDNVSAIEQLALRASYGTTGNAEIGNYEAQGLYSFTSNYIGTPASFPSRVPNPNLTWEVAHTINVGVDVDIMNRVGMSLDVYQKDNKDLLQNVTLPGTSGINSRIQNVGTVRNQGIEFQINTTNIETPSLNWSTDFTISTNKNRVMELADGEAIPRGSNMQIIEGEDINTFWLRKWHGVNTETGAPQWEAVTRNENGEITDVEIVEDYGDANNQIVGTSTPDFWGGIRNSVRYKNFSASAYFTYSYGGLGYYSDGIDFGAYETTNFRHLRPGESYWEEPGDEAHFPQNIMYGNNNGHRPSSLWLYDRSYLRLRNARISYNLSSDSSILQSAGMRTARIYVSGDNLATFSDWPGRDPASAQNTYPLARKLLFGIELGL